jgi:PKHD-type hydroxylase
MLITIPGVLGAQEAKAFRERLTQSEWQDGAATAGDLARSQKHNQQIDQRAEIARELGGEVLRRIGGHPLFVSAALPRRIYPPRFNRYADAGEYGAHVDSSLMRAPGEEQLIRTDLAATLFLSNPDDYDGGELEIESPFGAQAVKLPAGEMVLYPASSLHRVTPVTHGERLASFFWIESLVSDDGERALLFDLDQSIQRLRASGAEEGEMIRLSGLYHNLLRRWAKP